MFAYTNERNGELGKTTMADKDEYFMSLALEQAKVALESFNFPCGAVVVEDDKVIGMAPNRVYIENSATHHAEIKAIEDALRFKKQQGESVSVLRNATLYTTVDPCLMCAGAIQQAGIKRVVIAITIEGISDFSALMGLKKSGYNIGCDISAGVLFRQSRTLVEEWIGLREKVIEMKAKKISVDDILVETGLSRIHLKAWGIKE